MLTDEQIGDTLVALRRQYRRLHDTYFDSVVRNDTCTRLLQAASKKGNDAFQLSLMQPHHKQGVVELLTAAFSLQSNDLQWVVFNDDEQSMMHWFKGFQSMVDDALCYKQAMVILDKYNRVCGVQIYEDVCDRRPEYMLKRQNKHGQVYGTAEAYMYAHSIPSHHAILQQIYRRRYENELDVHRCYGRYRWGTMVATRVDCRGYGFQRVLQFVSTLMAHKLGYQYTIYRTTNLLFTRGWKAKMEQHPEIGIERIGDYKYLDHTFKDGSTVRQHLQRVKSKYQYSDLLVRDFTNNLGRITVWVFPTHNKTAHMWSKL